MVASRTQTDSSLAVDTSLSAVQVGNMRIGGGSPLALIAGPCVIETEEMTLRIAEKLQAVCEKLRIPFIFKASFDKANRSRGSSFRGLGIGEGLRILRKVRETLSVPVLTDVHEQTPFSEVADVVDVLQTPAFLCRQTDFLHAVCAQGKPVNIKKGQFLAPWDMAGVLEKAYSTGNRQILLCERGACFGYNYLVSDMRSLPVMRALGAPVVFDATHSVQLPGGLGHASGGQREFVPVLARAAVAVGVDALFMETHPEPEKALSDGPNCWPLDKMEDTLRTVQGIDEWVRLREGQQ